MVDKFLTKMYKNVDPYAVAMEAAMLAPKAEVSIYPWKEPKEPIGLPDG